MDFSPPFFSSAFADIFSRNRAFLPSSLLPLALSLVVVSIRVFIVLCTLIGISSVAPSLSVCLSFACACASLFDEPISVPAHPQIHRRRFNEAEVHKASFSMKKICLSWPQAGWPGLVEQPVPYTEQSTQHWVAQPMGQENNHSLAMRTAHISPESLLTNAGTMVYSQHISEKKITVPAARQLGLRHYSSLKLQQKKRQKKRKTHEVQNGFLAPKKRNKRKGKKIEEERKAIKWLSKQNRKSPAAFAFPFVFVAFVAFV